MKIDITALVMRYLLGLTGVVLCAYERKDPRSALRVIAGTPKDIWSLIGVLNALYKRVHKSIYGMDAGPLMSSANKR
jgi:hypothetical protein